MTAVRARTDGLSWWESFIVSLKFALGHFLLRTFLALQKKTAFKVDYGFGYNFHFETTEEELSKYLPDHFRPMPISTIEASTSKPRFLVSLYGAGTFMETQTQNVDSNGPTFPRVDVFTYIYDHKGLPALYFLRALTPANYFREHPNPVVERLNTFITWFCAMDPQDRTLGYDHLEVDELMIDEAKGIALKHKGASVAITKPASSLDYKHLFSRSFVAANSQIYRGQNTTRNVNFFNQEFLQVPVANIPVEDMDDLSSVDLSSCHPLCTKLIGAEAYRGVNGRPITWYFEFD